MPDANGFPRLSIPPEALTLFDTIDPGNTRRGALFAYSAVVMCGREFGDHELADAALRSIDQDCGRGARMAWRATPAVRVGPTSVRWMRECRRSRHVYHPSTSWTHAMTFYARVTRKVEVLATSFFNLEAVNCRF